MRLRNESAAEPFQIASEVLSLSACSRAFAWTAASETACSWVAR